MPTYAWKCKCDTITEIVRPMKDIDLPPDNGCESCGNKDIERTIVIDPKARNFILNGGGWHNDCYTSTRSRN